MPSPALQAAVAHFKAIGTPHVDVPEWLVDGKPLRIYWSPLTLKERDQLAQPGKTDADVLIAKALDDKGEKLFTLEDKALLLRSVDVSVISRIVLAMMLKPSVEDAEKN